jgi:anaphase-promoting complex subunit 3
MVDGASSSSAVQCADILRSLVEQNLSLFLYDNARFYAERLYYENASPENLHLLGQCYFRQGKLKQAYLVLQNSDLPTNRYLFALACIQLGKLSEAEKALSPRRSGSDLENLKTVPGGAAGLYLLGTISRREQRKEAAIDYFQKSLQLDPALWMSISELSDLGVAVDTKNLFGMDVATALAVVCSTEPSVAIGSSKSSSALSSDVELHPQESEYADPKFQFQKYGGHVNSSSSSGNNNGDRSSGKQDEHSTANKAHIAAVLERRRIAESLADASVFSPRTAMSLGLSSLSLRVPFATPGSVPSALPTAPVMYTYEEQSQMQLSGRRNLDHSISPIRMCQFTDASKGQDASSIVGVTMTSTLAQFDTDMRPRTSVRTGKSLFERSITSPELTPIIRAGNTTGLTPGYDALTLNSARRAGMDSPLNDTGVKSARAVLFADSRISEADSRLGASLSGTGSFALGSSMMQDRDDHELPIPPPPTAPRGDVPSSALPPTGPPTRRVSFGPTARLSFSNIGKGGVGAGASSSGVGGNNGTAGGVTGIGVDSAHSAVAVAVAPHPGVETGDLTDEHVMKFQRRCLDSVNLADGSPATGADPATPFTVSRGYFTDREHSIDAAGMSPIPIARGTPTSAAGPPGTAGPGQGPGPGNGASKLNDAAAGTVESIKENQMYNANINNRAAEHSVLVGTAPRGPDGGSNNTGADGGTRPSASGLGSNLTGPTGMNGNHQSSIPNGESYPDDAVAKAEAVKRTSALLTVFTEAYQLLCAYKCRECVALLHRLPRQHYLCGWVQQMLGKAYSEVNEYKPAVLALREMMRLEPFRVKGVETLSTALWHLKKDKELCTLAQQIVDIDKFCPEAWCVVGNCFSLQREPESALNFFQRALQVDPTFTYAHTLCGHELANNEDLEKAIQSFRTALLHDDRHYNAWFGLGSIYYRQEKFELAEYHFRRALSINAVSSVLRCYLSMALHAQGDEDKSLEALQVLAQACKIDPKNPQLHYQRAHVLLALDRCEEAVKALELVLALAPREPPVYSLLGQVQQRLGLTHDALRNFNVAISLDPKEGTALKAMLDRIDEPPSVEGLLDGYVE